jgi:hypothetical protein
MKKTTFRSTTLLLALSLASSLVHSQTTLNLKPSADASLGYHDGYSSASTNYGSSIHYSGFYQPGASGGVNFGQGAMKFDLSAIPTTATVSSATLDLFGIGPVGAGAVTSVGHSGANECYLERITTAWDEMIVTYNTRPTATATNRVTLPASSTFDQDYLGIDVTALVQDMVADPANSHGFLLRVVTESTSRGLIFGSSDYADTTKHPRLTITYSENGTAVETDQDAIQPKVWPNPATSKVNVSLLSPAETCDITLTDMAGKTLLKLAQQPANTEIPTAHLAPGAYLIRIESEGKSFARKFIQL